MRRKLNQRRTRAARQVANHGGEIVVLTNFPGREIWRGTVADLHAAPIVCGMPEPLLGAPTSTDPAVVVQGVLRRRAAR